MPHNKLHDPNGNGQDMSQGFTTPETESPPPNSKNGPCWRMPHNKLHDPNGNGQDMSRASPHQMGAGNNYVGPLQRQAKHHMDRLFQQTSGTTLVQWRETEMSGKCWETSWKQLITHASSTRELLIKFPSKRTPMPSMGHQTVPFIYSFMCIMVV